MRKPGRATSRAGLLKVWPQISAHFRSKLPNYLLAKLDTCPRRDFGEPVARRRLYILLVRRDLCRFVGSLQEAAERLWASASCRRVSTSLPERLLPRTCLPLAPAAREKREQAAGRWQEHHQTFCARHALGSVLPPRGESVAGVVTERERQMLGLAAAAYPYVPILVVDVSQNLSRTSTVRTDSCVGCLTRSCKIAIRTGGTWRLLHPLEKLVLQGIPVHRCRLPDSVSLGELGAMAGNGMHVRCVGAAIVIGLSLLLWPGEAPIAPARKRAAAAHPPSLECVHQGPRLRHI